MGCEGGVNIYDADAIEAHWGTDIWDRTGLGRELVNPLVTLGGHKYLVGTYNDCEGWFNGDPLEDLVSLSPDKER